MPFSWEIARARQESVLIGILATPGGTSVEWGLSFSNMEKPQLQDVMVTRGLPFGEARTQMAYQCLNAGYQWLFQLDCDLLCPKETIPCLMSHRLPIVSGLYYQRFATWTGVVGEYLPCMFRESVDAQGNTGKQPITDFRPGSLVEAAYVPTGCLLIHRSVFERFLAAGIKRIFEWTLHQDNPAGRSEDFEFCARARALGYKSLVDTSIVATHETGAQVGPKGLIPKL